MEDQHETVESILSRLRGLLEQREPTELYTLRRAAHVWDTSLTDVKRLVREGLVRSVPWNGRRKIPAKEVQRIAREGVPPLAGRTSRRGHAPPRARSPKDEAAMAMASVRARRSD